MRRFLVGAMLTGLLAAGAACGGETEPPPVLTETQVFTDFGFSIDYPSGSRQRNAGS